MIKLRDAVLSDYKAIAKLHAESWKKYYRGMYSDHFLDNDVEQNRLATWYDRFHAPANNQQVIVAVSEEQIVGFACIFTNDDPRFGTLLDNLHVSAAKQKTGIGKLLIKEAALRSYTNDKDSKFYLWVLELNVNARRFYENLGAGNYETIEKINTDGSKCNACRYTWGSAKELV